jgi:hypothetical protein
MAIGWPDDCAISAPVMFAKPANMPAPLEILLHCDFIPLEIFFVALRLRLVLVTVLVRLRLFLRATYLIKRKCIYLFLEKKV